MDAPLPDPDGTLVVDGRVRTGAFRRPFRDPGLARADVFGIPGLQPLLRLRKRDWFGFGVVHPDLYLATIVIDAGFAVISGLYVFDRARGAYAEHEGIVLDPRRGRVASGPYDDRTFAEAPGHRVAYRHRLDRGRHEVSIDIAATPRAPEVRAEIAVLEDPARTPPLVVSVPMRGRWFMYTHKTPAPVEGFVRVDGRDHVLDAGRDLANLDEHKGAFPWRQEWTWGTFAGRDDAGRLVAANLCDSLHYADPDGANENRLWLGDRLDGLGAVGFDLDPRDPLRPWRVSGSGGRVDLAFLPDGACRKRVGAGPVRLDYCQAFGRWRGTVVDGGGRAHEVRDLYGAAERGVGRN